MNAPAPTPGIGSPGIDHVVHCVADLDRAAARFEALGFTLTPRAQHPFGTGNRLAQLQGDFIELLSMTQPADVPEAGPGAFSFGAYNRDFLDRQGPGMSMLALKTKSWQDDRQRLRGAGIELFDPFAFGRTATQPDGTTVKFDFRLTFAPDPGFAEAVMFTCDHRHPPAQFWKADYQRHENTARNIDAVYMVAAEPAAHRPFLEKLFGTADETTDGLMVSLGDGGARLYLSGPEALARDLGGAVPPIPDGGGARFAGYGIAVDDPGAVEDRLAAADIDARPGAGVAQGCLVVPPDAGFGAALAFRGG